MKKILLALLILSSFNFCFAQENISVTKLPSGQKVVIKEVKDNAIVKIDTWINTGSINEDDKTTGISHFLEHLFFKGTEKYPTGEFDKILDSKGAIVNAATSKDYTHYHIQIPSQYFDLALELHADMLQNPMIPRKELERERPVVVEEISKCKDSPTNRMFDNLFKALYSQSNHPYKRPIIGTKEVIENVTREEILAYYNKFYTPDAFTTVIVGDVNKDYAIKKVQELFKQTKKKQEKVNYPKIKPLNRVVEIEDTMDINKTYYMMAYLAPKFSEAKDNYALDVLAVMLSKGKSSILNQELKENKELVLSVSAGNYSQKDSGIFYIYATLDPLKEELLNEEIINEIEKIKNGEFDKNILQKAKNMIKIDTYYARESISNISDDLGYDFTFAKDNNYYENYLKNIEKVSQEDIIRVAKKYLDSNKYVQSIVRPNGLKNISYTEDIVFDANKVLEKEENTTKTLLSNGITLTTKKKNTNSIIAIDISFKGSKTIEKKPTSALLASLSATSGTQNYTNAQFAQFLDENGIKLSVKSQNDIFSIILQTTKDNLDKAFLALDEVLNKPVFSNYEIDKIKQRKIQELKAVSDSPANFVFDEFKKIAFPNSIYGQNSTFILENINKVSRDDIVEFYTNLINPNNMYVTVVGDINESYIEEKLNSIVAKNDKKPKFDYSQMSYKQFVPSQNIEKTLNKKEVQAHWLALGYKTCGVLERRDSAVLTVINAILGEGMSSRLFVKLREQQGLAYTVGSTLNTYVKDGAFIAFIGTNKDSVEKAKQGILEEIETIKKEMVTTKELNDAKDKIMGQLLLSLETNMDEADLLNWYSVLGRDLRAFEEYKKLISEVSQNDIIEIANKYFSKPYIYVVVKESK